MVGASGLQELTKFINQCNEVKAATAANKEGGQLSIIKMAKDMNASQVKTSPSALFYWYHFTDFDVLFTE